MSCLSQGPSILYWRLLDLRAYCLNIYCDIYRQGRNSSILMNKTCTNDLLKVFVIHGQDNSWLTWNINAQWKNLHILFNNHKLSCTLSAALGVKTSAYFLNRKMPIKVKFKCCFVFFLPLNHMILYLPKTYTKSLTWIHLMQISLTHIFKKFPFLT